MFRPLGALASFLEADIDSWARPDLFQHLRGFRFSKWIEQFRESDLGTEFGRNAPVMGFRQVAKGFPALRSFSDRANAAAFGIGPFAAFIAVCRHQLVA
jgi:hypothetical protein